MESFKHCDIIFIWFDFFRLQPFNQNHWIRSQNAGICVNPRTTANGFRLANFWRTAYCSTSAPKLSIALILSPVKQIVHTMTDLVRHFCIFQIIEFHQNRNFLIEFCIWAKTVKKDYNTIFDFGFWILKFIKCKGYLEFFGVKSIGKPQVQVKLKFWKLKVNSLSSSFLKEWL